MISHPPAVARALHAECLKLKGTLALRAALMAPLLVGLLVAAERPPEAPAQFWGSLLKLAMTAWAIFMLPLTITLESALLAGVEHSNHTWKHVLALPLPRHAVYVAKIVVVAMLAALGTLVVIALVLIVGYVLMLLRPGLASAGAPPWRSMLLLGAKLWLASWLLVALQSWVSLRWPSFTVAIGVGIAGTFVALFASRAAVGMYVPWLLPMNSLSPDRLPLALWLGGAGGVVAAALACLELSGRDEGDPAWPRPRAVAVALIAASLFAGITAAAPTLQRTLEGAEARIRRVESGLTPSLNVKGEATTHTLAERMAFYQVPGMSIAVIDDGKIAWARAYGVIEAGTAVPVVPDTPFQAASISKPVTAIGALSAVQRGELSLDEDVNLRLRAWRVPESEHTSTTKVTLRGLLSHDAGVVEHRTSGYAPSEPIPTTLQVLDGLPPSKDPPITLERAPGGKWGYSGGGYVIVQQLLEDALGKPFPEIMRETVLEPLEMANSSFEQPLRIGWESRAARGHAQDGTPLAERWRRHPEMAAAGLWTTPRDLASLAIDLWRAWRGESGRALTPEMARRMLTREAGSFGLGMMVSGKDRLVAFAHEGANVGYRCSMIMNVETGRGAVVMTNADRGGGLMREVMRSIAREYDWPTFKVVEREPVRVDPALFARYTGRYAPTHAPEATITVTTRDGRLHLQTASMGPSPIEMLPLGENLFFVREDEGEITFRVEADGPASALICAYQGETLVAERIGKGKVP
ncbi:MAG: serine hydrolase [Phycisphaerae bacterium]|nr:serine hydrolase [Phycisphaerae bacterium]